ncbi:RHS repeat-associated core domain-containing protein [Trinickia caryophylli]|uniref:RHS repeat-associated core domain-containing protein n=1 Tax=Trinickia caryophylli TaxID=28094 RepID=A0A1X7FTD2_TRICW|nr:RHS repeat-associated core domain-containing protein [Trinickia caryophylli]WQE15600.1 RHS repeat-associated core domain-containing protein [Trinickia caryophylli]SMF58440.1 RHS repeat-associated core domain-containing protein [Trinickia caryophylli]
MSTITSPGFSGAYRDPVSFGYPLGHGYRWYLPALMRFSAPDNLSPFGPGGIHPYVYCTDDPINLIDPSGHMQASTFDDAMNDVFDAINAVEASERTAGNTTAGAAQNEIRQLASDMAQDAQMFQAPEPLPTSHQAVIGLHDRRQMPMGTLLPTLRGRGDGYVETPWTSTRTFDDNATLPANSQPSTSNVAQAPAQNSAAAPPPPVYEYDQIYQEAMSRAHPLSDPGLKLNHFIDVLEARGVTARQLKNYSSVYQLANDLGYVSSQNNPRSNALRILRSPKTNVLARERNIRILQWLGEPIPPDAQ